MNATEIKTAITKNAIVAVVAIGAGFVGSMIHDSFKTDATTIRAERFEIVDAGRLLSYWGRDSDPDIPTETQKGSLMVFMDTSGKRRCQIGSRVGDYGPELKFYGKDGRARVELELEEFDDPDLTFSNRDTWRILLGAIHEDAPGPSEDDWALRLRSGNAQSSIGAYRSYDGKTHSASLDLADAQRRWRFPPDPKGR